mmetsp:Transcript_24630/g.39637  ORF Transcript_24630/g.39637 Transcript_24630/m.39637 type:complete len:176 (+) Transcript_24630:331-858(+)
MAHYPQKWRDLKAALELFGKGMRTLNVAGPHSQRSVAEVIQCHAAVMQCLEEAAPGASTFNHYGLERLIIALKQFPTSAVLTSLEDAVAAFGIVVGAAAPASAPTTVGAAGAAAAAPAALSIYAPTSNVASTSSYSPQAAGTSAGTSAEGAAAVARLLQGANQYMDPAEGKGPAQ